MIFFFFLKHADIFSVSNSKCLKTLWFWGDLWKKNAKQEREDFYAETADVGLKRFSLRMEKKSLRHIKNTCTIKIYIYICFVFKLVVIWDSLVVRFLQNSIPGSTADCLSLLNFFFRRIIMYSFRRFSLSARRDA